MVVEINEIKPLSKAYLEVLISLQQVHMRTYIRRGGRAAYTRGQLLAAASQLRNGTPLQTVSRLTGIPARSLFRYKNAGIAQRPPLHCRRVFSTAQEAELADYITTCSDRFYGLSCKEARKLAVDFARANSISVPNSWTRTGLAGPDWLSAFQRRNKLSLRSPEATSMARASGFNAKSVGHFFGNLVTLLDKFRFGPGRILNLDESGITNVAVCPKVLAPTGRKQVGQITATERGTLVTGGVHY